MKEQNTTLKKRIKADDTLFSDDKKQQHYHIDLLVSSSKKSTEELWNYLFDELGINDCECTITDVRPASDEEIHTWFESTMTKEDFDELIGKDNRTMVQIIRKKAGEISPSSF